jgi:hypothetical protein
MTAPARIEGYGRRDGAGAMDHPAEGSRRRVAASNGRDRDRGGHKPYPQLPDASIPRLGGANF